MGNTIRRNSDDNFQLKDKDRRNRKASRSCLNHGGCPRCEGGRTHKKKRQAPAMEVGEWGYE